MTKVKEQPTMYLSVFLDSKGVTRAERTYYMKTFAAPTVLSHDFYKKTSQEWTNITKLK